MNDWLVAAAAGAIAGLAICPALTVRALNQLRTSEPIPRTLVLASAIAGFIGGAAGVAAAHRMQSWWWIPAFLTWAFTLVVAASCDARTQRIPKELVRQGAVLTASLVVIAAIATRDWRGLALALVGCASAGLILAVCWRFTGAGFGDVRLAIVGGMGLGHTSHRALTIAVSAFIVITTSQAMWALAHRRDCRARFAYGPAIAIGFLIAATA